MLILMVVNWISLELWEPNIVHQIWHMFQIKYIHFEIFTLWIYLIGATSMNFIIDWDTINWLIDITWNRYYIGDL